MTRLRPGYYRTQVMHDHGLTSWSLTCDIVRLGAGGWSLTITHGATVLLDGGALVATKREAIAAMNDALSRGWYATPQGWWSLNPVTSEEE